MIDLELLLDEIDQELKVLLKFAQETKDQQDKKITMDFVALANESKKMHIDAYNKVAVELGWSSIRQ